MTHSELILMSLILLVWPVVHRHRVTRAGQPSARGTDGVPPTVVGAASPWIRRAAGVSLVAVGWGAGRVVGWPCDVGRVWS